jgi:hypothetical protein
LHDDQVTSVQLTPLLESSRITMGGLGSFCQGTTDLGDSRQSREPPSCPQAGGGFFLA